MKIRCKCGKFLFSNVASRPTKSAMCIFCTEAFYTERNEATRGGPVFANYRATKGKNGRKKGKK